MTPWAVFILADSLSVRLLVISLPVVPYLASFPFNHFSIRSACFCKRLICFSRFVPPGPSGPGPRSSSLSPCRCSSRSCCTLVSSRSFFLCISDRVPLYSLEALDGSLRPSRAKKVPPKRSISWQNQEDLPEQGQDLVFHRGHESRNGAVIGLLAAGQ